MGRRTGCEWQASQVTLDDCDKGGREITLDIGDWRYCYALEGTIEVPMLEPMRIACDDRGFVAMSVISVIAVTLRNVFFVIVFVLAMMRFIRGIVTLDGRVLPPRCR